MTNTTRADILVIAPKIVQAVFAALGDYFTAKLAGKLFGGVVGWTSVRPSSYIHLLFPPFLDSGSI